jgi:succinoglycan biosynthesis protein ExoA
MDATGNRPDFSVIVPVAPGRAPLVLESLRHVDPNVDGATYEVLTQAGPNPSRNRNQRAHQASADVLAFTDDDCRVAPDWLSSAAAFFRDHPEYDAVGGPQLNGGDEGALGRASGHALASWFGTYRQCRRYRRAALDLAATQCDLTSANLFVTRRAFDAWGPFDERLWPNEETALLRRIELAGGKIAYDPAIVVFHKRRPSLRALARQCFGYGRGRARQASIEGARIPGISQLVPCLFLFYLALLPFFLVSTSLLALGPLAIYAAVTVAVSARTGVVEGDAPVAGLMPFAFLTIHAAYPAGFLFESLRIAIADPELASPADGAQASRPIAAREARLPR